MDLPDVHPDVDGRLEGLVALGAEVDHDLAAVAHGHKVLSEELLHGLVVLEEGRVVLLGLLQLDPGMFLGHVGLEGVVAGRVGGALGALEPAALQEMVVPGVGVGATGTLVFLSAWTACKVLAVLSDYILVHEFLDFPILGERRLSLWRAVTERDQNVPLLES